MSTPATVPYVAITYAGVNLDFTDLKEIREQLEAARAKAVEAAKTKPFAPGDRVHIVNLPTLKRLVLRTSVKELEFALSHLQNDPTTVISMDLKDFSILHSSRSTYELD